MRTLDPRAVCLIALFAAPACTQATVDDGALTSEHRRHGDMSSPGAVDAGTIADLLSADGGRSVGEGAVATPDLASSATPDATTAATATGTPYGGSPIALPATFPATSFDRGGEGVAYHDLSPGNQGGQLRTSEDVDIIASNDGDGAGYAIDSFETGEWLDYTVHLDAGGSYDLALKVSSHLATGAPAYRITVDGVDVTGSVAVAGTGAWDSFQWVGVTGVALASGDHVLRILSDMQYFNLAAIRVAASASSTSGGTGGAGTTPASLVFWSGFEGTSAVGIPHDCYSNGCWEDLVGSDPSTGYSWPPQLAQGGTPEFQELVNGPYPDPTTVGNYMFNDVRAVTGHRGNSTNALYQQITQSGCCGTNPQGGASTQDPYLLLPTSDVTEMYISYWAKFQDDFNDKMSIGTWRCLFEWKSSDTDQRMSVCIISYGGITPEWSTRLDGWDSSGNYFSTWRLDDTTDPVPVGEWFKVEVYWKRSTGNDGRIWAAINGTVIGDHDGPNYGPNGTPIDRIMVSQLYAGSAYPIYQWVDDLQIWTTFPTVKSTDGFYDPPYAGH